MMGSTGPTANETPEQWLNRWISIYPWLGTYVEHMAKNPQIINELPPAQQSAIDQIPGGKQAVVQAAQNYQTQSNFKKHLIWIIPSVLVAGGLVYVLTRPKKKP